MADDGLADIHEFPRTRPRVKKLRLALLLGGLSLLALVSTLFGMMMALAADIPALEGREEFDRAQNTTLVDVHGRSLGILSGPENRILIRSTQISPAMKHAVIAIEDRRFYDHQGVDMRAVARALVQDVIQRRAAQGGSTIAQQFVKNALKAQSDRTVFQKVREAAMAFHLSRKWSKEKILTEYLNAIYFGNGAYGIESAARTYFGKEPGHVGCGTSERPCAAELRPLEAALLAGIIASPSAYDPISNRAAALDRRGLVLQKMLEQGYITPEELEEAETDPGPANIEPPQVEEEDKRLAYFTSWIKQQVVDREGARRAFSGGLRVRTTLDLELQNAAEAAIDKWLPNPDGPTAALVAIDNDSGEVRAMIGGRDYNESPFNLATQGQRQPGSAFKPFILATALEQGISPGSTWSSRKKLLHSKALGCDFEVNNYEDAYAGVTTLASATTFSDNAVYAELGLKVGVGKIAKTAQQMGIRTPISKNCAMTLGGLREGVTPLDMAHAYQTFATGGKFVTGSLGPDRGPVGIKEIGRKEADGDVDVLRENEKKSERVLPANVAETSRQILSTVVTSGTAVNARLTEFAAGKTGTTENYGDAWFVGFTDRMTVAVWVGYPDKLQPMTTEYRGQPVAGGTYPAEIWRDFMVAVREAYETRENERREKEGLPPLTSTTTAPVPTTPTSPEAEAAQEETPTPSGGDPRPEDAPEGTQTPTPATPQEQPAAPEPEQPSNSAPPSDESGGAGAPST